MRHVLSCQTTPGQTTPGQTTPGHSKPGQIMFGRAAVCLALFASLAGPAAGADNLFFYKKKINTMSECHDVFTAQTPDWKTRANFVVRHLPGGREVVSQCLDDGVSQLYCDPLAKRSVVAVLVGETVPACSDLSPRLRIRAVDILAPTS